MKINVRKSADRGYVHHGWLESYHSFSFAGYYDPAHMGFRSLRVINQDVLSPGSGFPTHPHADMEIFSYLLSGALEHRDSLGNGCVLHPGHIQLMSAGRGVTHSEFNPSRTEAASLLQIWILPRQRGLLPSYTEWRPDPLQAEHPKVLLISADGREGSARIQQEADVYRVRLRAGERVTQEVRPGRGVWLQVTSGALDCQGILLESGDACHTEDPGELRIAAPEAPAEALLFDLE